MFISLLLLSTLSTPPVNCAAPSVSSVNISNILNSFQVCDCIASQHISYSLLLSSFQVGYDRRVRPNYGGQPVTVGVTLYILSIGDLSEKFMDFTFDMYFRQFWTDPRYQVECTQLFVNY